MDPSWCPGCDKRILPKRIVVPISPTPPPPVPSSPSDTEHVPPPPPAPTPVPSSPEVRKKPLHGVLDPARARRAYGGGLLQGTGRLRPGGGLRPRFPPPILPEQQHHHKKVITPPQLAPRAVQEAQILQGNPTATRIGTVHPPLGPPVVPVVTQAPRKTRVVISQEPTPLYCSDECRARDLKNSFIESESAGFAGASAARDRVAQLELINKTVERSMQSRRHSNSSDKPAAQPLGDAFLAPILPLQPESSTDREPRLPPVPPNSLVDPPPPLFHTGSLSSSSASSSVSSAHLRGSNSKNSTIRASTHKSRPSLPLRASSFSTWGSPTKAALAPPARSLLTASSSSSVGSSVSSSVGSALFDDEALAFVAAEAADGADTCGTTPSRRGSGSSTESTKKTQKRVSFAGDAKPAALAGTVLPPPEHVIMSPAEAREELRLLRRRKRNPLLDANPLRDALSVSPKDRVKASSLPSYSWADNSEDNTNGGNTTSSRSTPVLCGRVVDTPLPSRRPRYNVAMWPEDEKRTTESARVHGELLRGYAKRFGPREGRSLVWSQLWRETEAEAAAVKMSLERGAKGSASLRHEKQPDSKKSYWKVFEEQEAEGRARRKAEAEVERMEEERVICELLGGAGMRDEDQPQARKMKQMAYDGMPGPAELRGLTYKFDRFLYPLVPPKPKIVEKTVKKWDEGRKAWVEEVMREEVFEERKKLFNFSED